MVWRFGDSCFLLSASLWYQAISVNWIWKEADSPNLQAKSCWWFWFHLMQLSHHTRRYQSRGPVINFKLLYRPWTSLLDGPASFWKIWKRRFFQDIQNSFQWPTGIGPEPHQNFFRKKIPTNAVARAVQSFGRNGPWLAGWLSKGKNFFVNLAQTLDEHLLKISAQ